MYKRLFLLLIFIIAVIAAERLCHRITDGFEVANIRSALEPQAAWDTVALNQVEKDEIRTILAKPFYYLGKGAQSYVFASPDGKYVLKFFKFQHLRLPPFLDTIPLPDGLDDWRIAKQEKKQAELTKLFQSYKLAFDEVKDESGLIFLHLNKSSDLNCCLTLVDRLNIQHRLDADRLEFVLQKRANLVLPTLMAQQEKKTLLESLAKLLHTLDQKGIYDRDSHLTKNFGFIGDQAVLIDCGSLAKKKPEDEPKIKAGALKKWLGAEDPELLPFFENAMNNASAL